MGPGRFQYRLDPGSSPQTVLIRQKPRLGRHTSNGAIMVSCVKVRAGLTYPALATGACYSGFPFENG